MLLTSWQCIAFPTKAREEGVLTVSIPPRLSCPFCIRLICGSFHKGRELTVSHQSLIHPEIVEVDFMDWLFKLSSILASHEKRSCRNEHHSGQQGRRCIR